jgi:hypothetical protein
MVRISPLSVGVAALWSAALTIGIVSPGARAQAQVNLAPALPEYVRYFLDRPPADTDLATDVAVARVRVVVAPVGSGPGRSRAEDGSAGRILASRITCSNSSELVNCGENSL